MNILLISQCSKNALTETRRILDQFAERRGDRTWQTPITMDGLTTLRKLLKKTARKNTAVACHWIRGKDHSELMWIVGDQSQFSSEGAVPTNTTMRNILRCQDENQWHTAETISLIAGIAGLFHDFGKANCLFQQKLQPHYMGKGSEPIRHEWLSLRLFLAFIGEREDREWLQYLHGVCPELENDLLANVAKDGPGRLRNPLKSVLNRPVALVVAWLIVSHHRLPVFPSDRKQEGEPRSDEIDLWMTGRQLNAGWNSPQVFYDNWQEKDWETLWSFRTRTPLSSQRWCTKAQSLASRALKHAKLFEQDWINDRFSCHLARLVLMLSDHCYSASAPTLQWQDQNYGAFANTDRETRQPKQKLDEHNVGVGHNAFLMARRLPAIRQTLPAITRIKALKKRVVNSHFRWQDKAYDLASSIASRTENQGFFGINMASTGCGKTFANARIMYGLANERLGCRFNVALGLRTLTLQTGDDFRDKLHLNAEDLAVLVGSQAVRQLHEQRQQEAGSDSEQWGSESTEDFFEPGQHLRYEGTVDDGNLREWLQRSPRLHQLVSAPVLISTIDYLMPATEGGRGGKQIAPMLRLLTSDLVLDEPDDFGLEDLPALCRLVNWAGMLGSRVLLSSATLPPALIHALFEAYVAGRNEYNRSCGHPGTSAEVCCAWFDEFGVSQADHSQLAPFTVDHETFVGKRIVRLGQSEKTLRLGELLPVQPPSTAVEDILSSLANSLHQKIYALHQQHHNPHPITDKTVSLGLIRMANINPMVALARKLLVKEPPDNCRLHFCVYHSQHPLLVRSNIEAVLDCALNRNDPQALWRNPTIAEAVAAFPEDHHVFLVLGTAVTEVGRDHDYDWAIAEPSSMRSLIQLAGRIQRHRRNPPTTPNLLILNKNIRALRGDAIAYTRPGFESRDFTLACKDLSEILQPDQYEHINAIPRILPRKKTDARLNLVDLEHEHLQAKLFGNANVSFNASLWWGHNPTWCSEMQRKTPFRQSGPEERFVLYQEDETESPRFHLVTPKGELIEQENRFERVDLDIGQRVTPWIESCIEQLIGELAEREDMELAQCSRRFTSLQLRETERQWSYHPLLGIFNDLI
jgi:CRISPR-associated endonuclease/helicase Cas3